MAFKMMSSDTEAELLKYSSDIYVPSGDCNNNILHAITDSL